MFGIVNRDDKGEMPMDEIVVYYHEEFVKALKTFGFMSSPPTLLDVNIELLKHGAIIMMTMICFLPFSFVDWSTLRAEDMLANDSESTRNFKAKLYDLPIVKKLLQGEMKSWVHKGWI